MPRHRAVVPRLPRLLAIEWRALFAVQLVILGVAVGQITGVWTGAVPVRPWMVIVDGPLLIIYALGVLSRGGPETEGNHHE
jgi:sulfite exporter TauE/SafE